jgi:hypothetical protein
MPCARKTRQKSVGGERNPNDSKKVYSSACCGSTEESSLLFFTVSDKQTDPKSTCSLCSHGYLATITAKLATMSQHDVELMVSKSPGNQMGILIEVSSVILATFIPILENLQDMQRLSGLPFRQWIVPDRLGHQDEAPNVVPPPLYARDTSFKFSLKSILKDSSHDFLISPNSSPTDAEIIDKLTTRTELDRGQCEALMAALTREFALTQGPPGTVR